MLGVLCGCECISNSIIFSGFNFNDFRRICYKTHKKEVPDPAKSPVLGLGSLMIKEVSTFYVNNKTPVKAQHKILIFKLVVSLV
jgi:hypothetical protein